MHRGYVKLWRKSVESTLWQNKNAWRVFEWCLMKASYTERTIMIGYQEVTLHPGQLIYGRKAAAAETGLTEQVVRTAISHLKVTNTLTINSTNKYSIIQIENWELYQDNNHQDNQQNVTLITNKEPANNQQITTNKKDKKEKKDKKGKENIVIPSWINGATWAEFLAMRKKKKNPPTEYAQVLLVEKLSKLWEQGHEPNEVLKQSIERGWQSVFPLKDGGGSKPQPPESSQGYFSAKCVQCGTNRQLPDNNLSHGYIARKTPLLCVTCKSKQVFEEA